MPEHFKKIVLALLILVSALVLRLQNLDKYSLWYDEAIMVSDNWGLDKLPNLHKLFDAHFLVKHHDFLTLYSHGFLYYWQNIFTNSEFALRMSSVIFSILSICLLYLIGNEIFDARVALSAVFLLAVSPFHIYYSQELRPYAAACFLALVAFYSFLKVIKEGDKKYWWYYAAVNILNAYFLYITIISLIAYCLFFIWKIARFRHLLKSFLFTHIIIILLIIPLFLSLYPNLKFILYNNNINPAFSEFPSWFKEKVDFKYLVFTFKNFSIGYNTDFFSFAGWLATVVYFALFLIGIFKSYKNQYTRLTLLCLFTPILSLFFLSRVRACYLDRYFFPIFPLYLLVAGIALSRIDRKVILILAVILITGLNFYGLKSYYSNALPADRNQFVGIGQKQDIRGLIKVISANFKDGDRITHISKNTVFPLKFYIRQERASADLMRQADKGTVIFISDSYQKGRMFTVDYDKLYPTSFLPGEYNAAYGEVSASRRLWLILSDFIFPSSDDQAYEVVNRLKERFKEVKLYKFTGAYLYLFSKNERLGQ